MIVDAHVHFWDLALAPQPWLDAPDHAPIRRSLLPADLAGELRHHAGARAVFVQTRHDPAENAWALALADRHPWIAGVVGWIDLAGDDCARQLAAFRRHPKAVGIRHLVQGEPDGFLAGAAVRRGLRALADARCPFDLLLRPHQLRAAADLAAALPGLTVVLDHLAKPDLRTRRGLAHWAADLRALARQPNAHAKLSGLVTEAEWSRWTVADLRIAVAAAIDCFGPHRLLFGSDWPVCMLAGGWRRWADAVQELIAGLGAGDRARILGGNAAAFYRLDRAE